MRPKKGKEKKGRKGRDEKGREGKGSETKRRTGRRKGRAGTGNEYQPKEDDALRLRNKAGCFIAQGKFHAKDLVHGELHGASSTRGTQRASVTSAKCWIKDVVAIDAAALEAQSRNRAAATDEKKNRFSVLVAVVNRQ